MHGHLNNVRPVEILRGTFHSSPVYLRYMIYKYERIVVKLRCEIFGCDYCVLLTINVLCRVEVMFIQLLNLLERHCVYLHLCLLSLSSHKIV